MPTGLACTKHSLYELPHDRHDLPPPLPAMDADLIKLVNKLQDTFANLGMCLSCLLLPCNSRASRRRVGHAPARRGSYPPSV